jgi:TPR repeat protein
MPRLLRSSETAGCGATIELDNKDVVFVSIAQTGVLVRLINIRGGLIKNIMSNLFGPTLYNEKNVFKNAKTAEALSTIFPEETSFLSFKNPVLTAFANAIWHCSSAAEVSIVLNDTIARTEASPATMSQPSAMQATEPSREMIIGDYGAFMEHNPSLPTRIEDVSVLPHPKEVILDALLMEIGRGHPRHLDEMMQVGARCLAQYQPGVGKEPLEKLGLDISKLPRTKDPDALRAQAKLMSEAISKTADRFNAFEKLVEDDLRRISSKIAAAQSRNTRAAWSEETARLHRLAEDGKASAQNDLGLMYAEGRGVEKNDREAFGYFRNAAEQGYCVAQYNLGVAYRHGRGIEKNDHKAVAWYRKAAEQGYAPAQSNLGVMYENGWGVEKNEREAFAWMVKAAEQAHAAAQRNLGAMYADGRGVEKNDRAAFAWMVKAAEQGHARAQFHLGAMYETGRGVEKNKRDAVAWYRKAAEQGSVEAQARLQARAELPSA